MYLKLFLKFCNNSLLHKKIIKDINLVIHILLNLFIAIYIEKSFKISALPDIILVSAFKFVIIKF